MGRFVAVLVLVAALTCAAVALGATAPTAATGSATGVAPTQATLTATVDPKGSATTVHFDLGTTTSYGLQSATKDAGSGTGPVTVEIPVQGLTSDTTYHARVVATSDGGTAQGGDVTFRTAPAPARASVSTGGVRQVTPTGATLTGSVTPHASATTYHFEYGTSTAYGSSTPSADAGAGTRGVSVSAAIGGLAAGKTYHYRLVASNALGTTRGRDRSFRAGTTATSATLTANSQRVTYGRSVVLSGKVDGSRRSGVAIRLQTTAFPFGAPFADTLRPTKTSSSGAFSFTLPAVLTTTRALVIADGTPPVVSKMVVIRSAVRTGITSVSRSRATVTVRGRLTPATANGVAALQRQASGGRWVPLRRAHVGADGRYTITLRARRRAMLVRAVGLPHDGGAHVSGVSRTVKVAARR